MSQNEAPLTQSDILGGTIEASDLKTHVRGLLADYKAPRHYVMVEIVPRADNGKANYKFAKEIAMDALGLV